MQKYFSKMKVVLMGLWMLIPALSLAQSNLPAGNPITFNGIDSLVATLLQFIIGVSAVIMVGSIVISGIMITMSGNNPTQYKNGLAMLKTSIYGAAVILGTGVIINTIFALVTRQFFCQVGLGGVCLY